MYNDAMEIRDNVQKQFKQALHTLGMEIEHIELTHPKDPSQGDYATNVAMVLAKKAGKNPRELAEQIVGAFTKQDSGLNIDRIEVAGPGFINIFFKPEHFIEVLKKQLNDSGKTRKTSFTGKKVMVEFTDPNPFKEFHIGHLYSNTVGESISRLIEAGGAEVKRANYQGDVGLHVAKAIWGMQRKLQTEGNDLSAIGERSIEERAKWLGKSYALGAAAYEEDEKAKEEIISINKAVYSLLDGKKDEPALADLYQKGREWSLSYFETIYQRLGTSFAYYYFESEAGPIGLALVKEYLSSGVFTESEGAVVFKGEDYGLHTRVFINSLGLPTYEAKELGLAVTKYEDFPFDFSISITGNEINEYFRVLLKVLSLIKPEIAKKMRHISHGMVRLPEGKMSSRTGNVLTGEWLLNEAKRRLAESYPDMEDETLETVTVAAIKWAMLRSGIGKDISFTIDESISFEGDSGPYIQYTYARTQSVLGKSTEQRVKDFNEASFTGIILEKEETELLKLLSQYDEVVTEAGGHFSPNIVTNYLFDVAKAFNLFYQKQRILNPTSVNSTEAISQDGDTVETIRTLRLALTKATGYILKDGLHLLGIKAPEKM